MIEAEGYEPFTAAQKARIWRAVTRTAYTICEDRDLRPEAAAHSVNFAFEELIQLVEGSEALSGKQIQEMVRQAKHPEDVSDGRHEEEGAAGREGRGL